MAVESPPHVAPPLLSIPEVCEYLGGVGRSQLYKMMSNGDLRPIHIGKLVRFVREDLERYVDRLRQEAR